MLPRGKRARSRRKTSWYRLALSKSSSGYLGASSPVFSFELPIQRCSFPASDASSPTSSLAVR
eukprot:3939957-Rhodomonas_salina.1